MKKNKTKYNTICVGHHSTQANTNNVNGFSYKQLEVKTNRTLFCAEIATDITTWNSERKDILYYIFTLCTTIHQSTTSLNA